jgi:hypothetical protein
MVRRIELAEQKLIRKIKAARPKWVEMVKRAESLDAYVKGIADFAGIPESVVRASLPVKNWAEFQRNAEAYVDILIEKVVRAVESGKWRKGYILAFGGSA